MRKNIWDIIFWIGMIIVIGYIILKLLKIINTPEWLNLLPIIGLAFAIGASYQNVMSSLERLFNRTNYFKSKLDNIDNKLSNHQERLIKIEHKKWK